jgi:hypothetical protein
VSVHPGWSSPVLPAVTGGTAGPRRLRWRCGHRFPTSVRPDLRTDPDQGEWVAGPGFEPGKAFADDLQTLAESALSCANARVTRGLGMDWTRSRGTFRTLAPPGKAAFTDPVGVVEHRPFVVALYEVEPTERDRVSERGLSSITIRWDAGR